MARHDPFLQELTVQWEWESKETNKLSYNGGSCVLAVLAHFWRCVEDRARNSLWGVKESSVKEISIKER